MNASESKLISAFIRNVKMCPDCISCRNTAGDILPLALERDKEVEMLRSENERLTMDLTQCKRDLAAGVDQGMKAIAAYRDAANERDQARAELAAMKGNP